MNRSKSKSSFLFTGKHNNNNITSANNNGGVIPIPLSKPKQERRRTVSFRKGVYDPREELLRRSTTPDVKEVGIAIGKEFFGHFFLVFSQTKFTIPVPIFMETLAEFWFNPIHFQLMIFI